MVKHIILWQLKDELSAAEKAEIKANIKTGLEGLAGQIPGLVEVHVNINGLPSSNADLMLDTTFYARNPSALRRRLEAKHLRRLSRSAYLLRHAPERSPYGVSVPNRVSGMKKSLKTAI